MHEKLLHAPSEFWDNEVLARANGDSFKTVVSCELKYLWLLSYSW